MDIQNILKQLREEHEQLTETILAMERLVAGRPRGRGRPPKWLDDAKTNAPKRRGRPPGTGRKPEAAKGE
jgi:hypothetical protein